MLQLPNRKANLPNFPEWHLRAACFGTEADYFFSPDSSVTDQYEEQAVIEARYFFCDHCPVRNDCLESALLNGDVGIWAGMTTYQRNQLRRKRNRAKCPICENRKLINVEDHWLCLACGVSWNGEASSETKAEKED